MVYLELVGDSDAVCLVEDGEVRGVDLVPSVDVAEHEELVEAHSHQLQLVGCHVGAQQVVPVDIVAICFRPARVIPWNQQAVKILLHRHNWIQIVVNRENRIAPVGNKSFIKIIDNFLIKKRNRMMFLFVNVPI